MPFSILFIYLIIAYFVITNNAPPTASSLNTDEQTELNTTVISDTQKTSDALKQIENDRLVQQMKDDDAVR
jgi:hypothetical protein